MPFWIKGVCILLSILVVALMVDFKVRPIIRKLSESQAIATATTIINEAVEQVLEEENVKYNTLIDMQKDESGSVTSVQANITEVNDFKSKVTQRISEKISSVENRVVKIPIGTLIGGTFFSGRGPNVNFYISLSGSAKTKLSQSFSEAGINQTLHTVSLDVESTINIICAGYNSNAKSNTNIVVAQTVIVGKTPDTYNHISTALEDYLENYNVME